MVQRWQAGSTDKTVRLWDAVTGQHKVTLKHTSYVTSVAFSPDSSTLASGLGNHMVCLWVVATGQLKTTFRGHTAEVEIVEFSPDGTMLASGSDDRTVRLWGVATGQHKATLTGLDSLGTITSVAFSPDGMTLASEGINTPLLRVYLWDVATGQLKTTG